MNIKIKQHIVLAACIISTSLQPLQATDTATSVQEQVDQACLNGDYSTLTTLLDKGSLDGIMRSRLRATLESRRADSSGVIVLAGITGVASGIGFLVTKTRKDTAAAPAALLTLSLLSLGLTAEGIRNNFTIRRLLTRLKA